MSSRIRKSPARYSRADAAPAPSEPAAFALILGAGFSYGVVPLAKELMQQTIGDYYCYDQDQSSMERPESVSKRLRAFLGAIQPSGSKSKPASD